MKTIIFWLLALALVLWGVAKSQTTTDFGDINLDVGSELVLTDYSDSSVVLSSWDGRRRALPVAFEVQVLNGKANLRDGKVYLTEGDLTLRVIFASGDTEWVASIPMEREDDQAINN